MNNKTRDLYYVKEKYDSHVINDMIKGILNIDCTRTNNYSGEIMSVKYEDYFEALKFVTKELLRRNPESEVKWIDYYQNQRPYEYFCYGMLSLKEEYQNTDNISVIINELNELFNNNENNIEGKAPISINIKEDGNIYLEGNIHYDDSAKFWHDLRFYGLCGVFTQRRKYCFNIIEANYPIINKYIDVCYPALLDGEIITNSELSNEFSLDKPKQKIKTQ